MWQRKRPCQPVPPAELAQLELATRVVETGLAELRLYLAVPPLDWVEYVKLRKSIALWRLENSNLSEAAKTQIRGMDSMWRSDDAIPSQQYLESLLGKNFPMVIELQRRVMEEMVKGE